MSFILDALKKLERTRARGPVPNLDLEVKPVPPKSPEWLPWACAAIALTLAIGAWVWRLSERGTDSSSATPLAERQPAPAAKPTSAAKLNPPKDAAAVKSKPVKREPNDQPVVAAAEEGVRTPALVQPAPKVVSPSALAPAADRKIPTDSPRAVRQVPGTIPAPVKPVPDMLDQPLRPVPAKPAREALRPTSSPAVESVKKPIAEEPVEVEPTAPTLEELSPELQAAIPKLKISILAYASGAADRMAYINGQKYVEGQLVDGKVKVESIVRQGVILSIQGQRFLLRP